MSRDGEPPVSAESGTGPEAEPGPPPGAPGRANGGAAGKAAGGADGDALRADIRDALTGLAARLDREHERAAHREAVIDRLHEENQRLRRGELQAMLEPVRAALYRLHDQARRESGRLAAADLAEPPDPRGTALLLEAVADDVADALARLGVERFTVEPGAPYDASRHRPVAVTPVDDPIRDGTVTGVESDGFEQSGKVLRKAAVRVGKLDTKHEKPESHDKPETKAEAGSNGTERAVKAGSNRRNGAGNAGNSGNGETMRADTQKTDG
ncbi:nucleotide exchange factor GrpE [Actinomadura sp. KC216]|uniref:nucleotide exchange factor GrpE n=1 Tax=Actinomadura sp. KC216 TaxID=2530370 RepID=UPI0010462525|nr:nucleotide exchange factor GrpE [Actinomadura sp. KC216]TDB83836.1 nucleotide exchange factor GrpE [Actinomadura sp. KC216]